MAERGANLGFGGGLPPSEARRVLGLPQFDVPAIISQYYPQASSGFGFGTFVTAGATWTVATNATRGQEADGLVVRATDAGIWVATLSGQPISWPGHGLGSAGTLWLGTAGAPTATEPTSSSVKVLQRIGRISGTAAIILQIEHPTNL